VAAGDRQQRINNTEHCSEHIRIKGKHGNRTPCLDLSNLKRLAEMLNMALELPVAGISIAVHRLLPNGQNNAARFADYTVTTTGGIDHERTSRMNAIFVALLTTED
jgi:hypothetical protein